MIDILYSKIGTYDEVLDCLYPVYLINPGLPIYKKIQDKDYIINTISKHCYPVPSMNAKVGDLLLFKFRTGFHFGIYAGNDKFFHACKRHGLRISKLDGMYKNYMKGLYRWHLQSHS